MDDATLRMKVVETEQNLFRYLANNVCWDTAMLVSLDKPKQVLAEYFKHHANVRAVGPIVAKVVDQSYDVRTAGMRFGRGCDSLKKLDLVQCRLGIVAI